MPYTLPFFAGNCVRRRCFSVVATPPRPRAVVLVSDGAELWTSPPRAPTEAGPGQSRPEVRWAGPPVTPCTSQHFLEMQPQGRRHKALSWRQCCGLPRLSQGSQAMGSPHTHTVAAPLDAQHSERPPAGAAGGGGGRSEPSSWRISHAAVSWGWCLLGEFPHPLHPAFSPSPMLHRQVGAHW